MLVFKKCVLRSKFLCSLQVYSVGSPHPCVCWFNKNYDGSKRNDYDMWNNYHNLWYNWLQSEKYLTSKHAWNYACYKTTLSQKRNILRRDYVLKQEWKCKHLCKGVFVVRGICFTRSKCLSIKFIVIYIFKYWKPCD